MSKDICWLLAEIEGQIDGRLSPESTQLLLAEVESHLDTGIRARIADGMERKQAEAEAVRTFGPPEAYVNDLLHIHERKAGKRNYWWGTTKPNWPTIISFVACCIWCLFYFTYSLRNGSVPLLLWIGVACGAVFAVSSFRARRVQILPIAFATPLAYVSGVLIYSLIWLTVWHHGAENTTAISVWEANSVSRLEKVRIAQIDQTLGAIQGASAMHFEKMTRSEIGQLPPETRSLLLLPLGKFEPQSRPTLHPWGVFNGPIVNHLGRYPTDDAIRQWRFGAVRAKTSLQQARRESEKEISAIAAAQKSYPLGDIGTNLSQMRSLLWLWFVVGVALNVVSVGIAQLVHSSIGQRIRRRLA